MAFSSMRDLLGGAGRRGGVQRQLTAAFIVNKANECLQSFLPKNGKHDAIVVAYTNSCLKIDVTNGIVTEYLRKRECDFLSKLSFELQVGDIRRVVYRIRRHM